MEVFVFGSNLAGRHGAGAAATAAKHHGAVHGVGVGPLARSYAIPTKDCNIQVLPRLTIMIYVGQFLHYAYLHHIHNIKVTFKVTRIGCGLAGYKDFEIAPMFSMAPPNCYFDLKWHNWLGDLHRYWGTF